MTLGCNGQKMTCVPSVTLKEGDDTWMTCLRAHARVGMCLSSYIAITLSTTSSAKVMHPRNHSLHNESLQPHRIRLQTCIRNDHHLLLAT